MEITKDQIDQYIRDNISEIGKHFPIEMEDMLEPYEHYDLLRGYAVACISIREILKEEICWWSNIVRQDCHRAVIRIASSVGISLEGE